MNDILDSPESIANKIAFENDDWFDISLDVLAARIETALRRERERAGMSYSDIHDGDTLAEQLHCWYLDATRFLSPAAYNPNAQKAFGALTPEQQQIDRFIAGKVRRLIDREQERADKYQSLARALAEALEIVLQIYDNPLPPPPDHQCGSPNAACDMDCADFANGVSALAQARNILTNYYRAVGKETG